MFGAMRYKVKVVNPEKGIISARPTAGSVALYMLVPLALSILPVVWMSLKDKTIETPDKDTLDVPEFIKDAQS